jgi:hypothetical protein
MNTTTLSGDELYRLVDEYTEPEALASFDGHAFMPGELYLIKHKTQRDVLAHSVRLGEHLATTSPVLYIGCLSSRNHILREMKQMPNESRASAFLIEQFSMHEVPDAADKLTVQVESEGIRVVIINSFEKAAKNERHKSDLVHMLVNFAYEMNCVVIVYTQNDRVKLVAGEWSRGALGDLASSCAEIIDVKKEEAMKPLLEPKPEPAVKWKHKNFPMTYKQRFGVSVASRVHRDDAEFVLDFIKKKRQDFIDGKYKLRKVSEAEEQQIIKKFLDANVEEIKELEERVYQIGLEKQREHELGMDTVDYKMRWG